MNQESYGREFHGRDLTKIADLGVQDVEMILSRAEGFRRKSTDGVRRENILDGRVVAMIFEKPSLRTKVAFEVATHYLGGVPVFLSSSQILASGGHEHGRESIPDIARNLERFCDLIVARVYQHEVIARISEATDKPVINALCDQHHPTQALADLLAMKLALNRPWSEMKVAFIGDGNNVATSLMQACALVGVRFNIAAPEGYQISPNELKVGVQFARKSGSEILQFTHPAEAVRGADVVYTDTFTSMGQESQKETRDLAFAGYQVNEKLMKAAASGAIFMHCLPAHRGEEVTDAVMDSKASIVFDQAECRLHIAKALLALYLA